MKSRNPKQTQKQIMLKILIKTEHKIYFEKNQKQTNENKMAKTKPQMKKKELKVNTLSIDTMSMCCLVFKTGTKYN